jgi:hypothetical protein
MGNQEVESQLAITGNAHSLSLIESGSASPFLTCPTSLRGQWMSFTSQPTTMSDLPGGFRKITSEKTREASVSPLNECIGDLPLFQNSRSGVED